MPIIAVIADCHVGHPAAIWPRKFTTDKGNEILPNKAQGVLMTYWEDFWKQQDAKDADYIVNLAESIEGYSPKEHGTHGEIMTQSLDKQISAFQQLLDKEIKGRKYICVEGSKYHGSQDMRIEEVINKHFRGEYFGYIGVWNPKKTDKIIMLTHKQTGALLYKSAALDRWSLYMSAVKSKIGVDPDMILSAHIHMYFRVDTATRINLSCPTWKFWHPIKSAERYPFSQPSIGGVIIKIGAKIQADPYLYPLQHIYDELVRM